VSIKDGYGHTKMASKDTIQDTAQPNDSPQPNHRLRWTI